MELISQIGRGVKRKFQIGGGSKGYIANRWWRIESLGGDKRNLILDLENGKTIFHSEFSYFLFSFRSFAPQAA